MRSSIAVRAAIVGGYLLAACLFTWPLALHVSTHLTGDPGGDTGVYVWNQWVFHQEVLAGHNPLKTEKILSLSGAPADLTQHNYTPFLNALALPLIEPLGLIAAFNIVFLLTCALNGVAAYQLARTVTSATRLEAWLAGLVFAWSPAIAARTIGHFSIVAAAALPAFLHALVAAERSRTTRSAAVVGLCVAWAALSDAYYGIYCMLLALVYVGIAVVRVTRSANAPRRPLLWLLDILIVCVAGLVAGLSAGRGGEWTVLGIAIHVRTLYNPMLALTILVLARVLVSCCRPRIEWPPHTAWPIKSALVAILACATPLSPVLYGLGERVKQGRFVNPTIFWRSSPRGVDLLAFVTPNPRHPVMRWLFGDPAVAHPTHYVEYTASLSLVSIAVIAIAMWRAGYRPHRAILAVTLVFALLALGPFVWIGGLNTHVPGPWALLRYVPGVGLARMPTRFVVVAVLGLSVLMAGALAALGSRWPHRRRQIAWVATALIVIELWPGTRPLYSADVSPVYERIGADPRNVSVLVLPFGVRDGTWETGNFRPRTQFNQTRHGKKLIGGYLSRISPRRIDRMRQNYPTLDALIALSEPDPLAPQFVTLLQARGNRLIEQGNIGYVVIDSRFVAPERARLVIDAFRLRLLQEDDALALYEPERSP